MGPPGVLLSSTNDMIVTPTRSTTLCSTRRTRYSVTAHLTSFYVVASCGLLPGPAHEFLAVASCGLLPRTTRPGPRLWTAFWSVASPHPREAGVARALAVGAMLVQLLVSWAASCAGFRLA